MKKFIIGWIAVFTVLTCKKEAPAGVQPTAKESTAPAGSATNTGLKEVSAENISENLRPKKNDTLYITNFFATWCGPCMREIPEFMAKMHELEHKPVKFTFVSLDDKTDWNEAVKNFSQENSLTKNVVLLDGSKLTPVFFTQNFKTWKGDTIPFTLMRKGEKTEEIQGGMSKEELSEKIESFR